MYLSEMRKQSIILFLLCLVLTSCVDENNAIVNVVVASNTHFAMKELVQAFQQETGIKVQLITASSGKLTAQIKQGAPFDIFVSADMKYPQELFESSFSKEPPRIYALGKLVLWSKEKILDSVQSALRDSDVQHIAIANPMTAPYGKAAKEVLVKYSLWEEIQPKLVFGESISQTNQFIQSGAADFGFTAKAIVMAPQMQNIGSWLDIPDGDYSEIKQGAIMIKRKGQNSRGVKSFYNFLFSEKAKSILVNYGYEINS